jgi:Bacterial Ig domain
MIRKVIFAVAAVGLLVLASSALGATQKSTCKGRKTCPVSTTDTTPPRVSLTSPTVGTTVSGAITVSGTAADDVSVSAVKVQVDSGATLLAQGTTSWTSPLDTTSVTDGSHTIAVVAVDSSGNLAATSVTINVSNPVTTPDPVPAPAPAPAPAPDPGTDSPCTLYVSPTGSSSNTGGSSTSPIRLDDAAGRAVPGDVVCLTAGTYSVPSPLYLSRSGVAGSPIVYRSEGGEAVLRSTASTPDDMIQVTAGTSYLSFRGLTFDGAGVGDDAVHCKQGSNHIVFAGNTVRDTASVGFSGSGCDYVRVNRNLFYHIGYNPATSWGSAVTLNSSQWSDTAAGFHSYVVNNIISGTTDESSYHSDGNGIIMDMGGNVPPVLIANNVVYENGGRCIHAFHAQNIWVVNNTCYNNGLDNRETYLGEIVAGGSDTNGIHFINNIVAAAPGIYQYQLFNGATATLQTDDGHGGLVNIAPTFTADPRFVDPPTVDWSLAEPQSGALAPWNLASRLKLQTDSPMVNAGIDPRTATGMTDALRTGIDEFLSTDILGVARPTGGGFDLGAYEQ